MLDTDKEVNSLSKVDKLVDKSTGKTLTKEEFIKYIKGGRW